MRRKIVIAAKALQGNKQERILDIALQLGFQSHETFSRAFRKVWNCSPSEYVRKYQFSDLYPRYAVAELEGVYNMAKKVDISESYDLFQERKGCCFVCAVWQKKCLLSGSRIFINQVRENGVCLRNILHSAILRK